MICGKKIYANQTEAKEAIRGFNQANKYRQGGTNRSSRPPTNAYFCADCKGWHTETEGKRRKLSDRPTKKETLQPIESVKPTGGTLHILNPCKIRITNE